MREMDSVLAVPDCDTACIGGIQLNMSNNLEAVTAQYVDVRMERKLFVLNTYHKAVLGE